MHRYITGGNLSAVKRQNRSAVLRVILSQARVSRHEISRLTGVRAATVTNIVSELLADGLVEELGQVSSGSAGRRRRLLGLRDEAVTVGAVDFRLTGVAVAITDLCARIIDSTILPLPSQPDPETAMDSIAEGLHRLISKRGMTVDQLLGVGIGCIGPVDRAAGVNLVAESLGWRNVPVAAMLSERLGIPAVADGRARAMAAAERLFGYGRMHSNLAVVYVGWGIGSGLIIDNHLLRGSFNFAGEVGHIVVLPDGEPCECGNRGCLETVGSGSALVTQARTFLAAHPGSPLAQLVASGGLTPGSIMSAAGAGDPDAREMVSHLAKYLGAGIANLVTLFNPSVVVMCGPILEAGDFLLDSLRDVVRRSSFAARSEPGVEIVASAMGKDVEIMGAASLALEQALYDPPPSTNEPAWRAANFLSIT